METWNISIFYMYDSSKLFINLINFDSVLDIRLLLLLYPQFLVHRLRTTMHCSFGLFPNLDLKEDKAHSWLIEYTLAARAYLDHNKITSNKQHSMVPVIELKEKDKPIKTTWNRNKRG
ncbi:hypothetical protein I7I50_01364 [Histoplasma capsulatum G186AR]|uniref:Uncharacterized protein n=1 Tax=Ajellomyces capsulatus TaxID=5037 RepID=A0A8H8CU46_AJECA|nr:hypothetical protein I7I52_12480 [Histoplasma capsulatum]QSS73261.1 hypothetical protein I7I50_01364 [Histoplasma capsulatum G186AR]